MSDIDPTWELTDKQLSEYLGLEEHLVAKMPAGTRASYVHMAWVEKELNAGRRPRGVLVCEE
jgi:hypothetical protein